MSYKKTHLKLIRNDTSRGECRIERKQDSTKSALVQQKHHKVAVWWLKVALLFRDLDTFYAIIVVACTWTTDYYYDAFLNQSFWPLVVTNLKYFLHYVGFFSIQLLFWLVGLLGVLPVFYKI